MKVKDKTLIENQQDAARISLRSKPTQIQEQAAEKAKLSRILDTQEGAGVTTSVSLGMPTSETIAMERRQKVEELKASYQAGKLRPAPSTEIAKKMVEESYFDSLFVGGKAENE